MKWILNDKYIKSVFILTIIIIFGLYILSILNNKTTNKVNINDKSKLHGPYKVVKVFDGDTVLLSNGEKVRLIGVDAPEVHHPEIPVQRFGKESYMYLNKIAYGFNCMLEYEPNNLRDKYDRLLAYVYINNKMINAELIKYGYAYAYLKFPYKHKSYFIKLEKKARERQYGLWSLSLKDGRIANIINKYESLNIEGRKKFDAILSNLVQKYALD